MLKRGKYPSAANISGIGDFALLNLEKIGESTPRADAFERFTGLGARARDRSIAVDNDGDRRDGVNGLPRGMLWIVLQRDLRV